MDLVLFEDAMKHIAKITRIISNPSGHALLVGVGGSGKQSLSKLSGYICQLTLKRIVISSSYGLNDLKVDLQDMYNKAGVKDEGIIFLFTDSQITNERFLIYLNDLLASGEIADLYPIEDKDTIINNVRGATKSAGLTDSRDNCWGFFINRVKTNLHMSICCSPVGEDLRQRATKFPALINNTVIDWFQPWPYEAMLSVSDKFLSKIELGEEDTKNAIIKFMPFSFNIVDSMSDEILTIEKKHV